MQEFQSENSVFACILRPFRAEKMQSLVPYGGFDMTYVT